MANAIRVPVDGWEPFLEEVEFVFRRPVPDEFRTGPIDSEALFKALVPAQDDAFFRGKILLGHELRLTLAEQLDRSPASFTDSDQISELIPGPIRRKVWDALAQGSDFQWPRLGMPVWGQTLYGFCLLAAFVLCFIYPLLGLGLFFGGIILSYRVERWSRSFQYKTLLEVVEAAVRRSWPALELGAADDARLEAVFAEVLTRHIPMDLEGMDALPRIDIDDPWSRPQQQVHILNGDSLREQLSEIGLRGTVVVMRECMVVGPAGLGPDFWSSRKAFIHAAYDADEGKYDRWVGEEMAKLSHLPANAEVNLWFENDLFCQANMWFMVHELEERGFSGPLYRIFPVGAADGDTWANFSKMEEAEFLAAYGNRIGFTPADREIVERLWSAFANDDFTTLKRLAVSQSHVLQGLPEVVQAHVDRQPDTNGLGRPERTLKEIQATGISSFEDVFREFTRREPIYGYGDLQVKEILERLQS